MSDTSNQGYVPRELPANFEIDPYRGHYAGSDGRTTVKVYTGALYGQSAMKIGFWLRATAEARDVSAAPTAEEYRRFECSYKATEIRAAASDLAVIAIDELSIKLGEKE